MVLHAPIGGGGLCNLSCGACAGCYNDSTRLHYGKGPTGLFVPFFRHFSISLRQAAGWHGRERGLSVQYRILVSDLAAGEKLEASSSGQIRVGGVRSADKARQISREALRCLSGSARLP